LSINNGNPQPIGQQVIDKVAQCKLVEHFINYLNWLRGCFFYEAGRFGEGFASFVFGEFIGLVLLSIASFGCSAFPLRITQAASIRDSSFS
jgi:hypothetical protein